MRQVSLSHFHIFPSATESVRMYRNLNTYWFRFRNFWVELNWIVFFFLFFFSSYCCCFCCCCFCCCCCWCCYWWCWCHYLVMVWWQKNSALMEWYSTITLRIRKNAIYHITLTAQNDRNYVSPGCITFYFVSIFAIHLHGKLENVKFNLNIPNWWLNWGWVMYGNGMYTHILQCYDECYHHSIIFQTWHLDLIKNRSRCFWNNRIVNFNIENEIVW